MKDSFLEQFLRSCCEKTEHALKHHLDTVSGAPELTEAMRYATLGTGKRIRPALVHATAELLMIPGQQSLDIASSLELAHCFSLIHDDLPAMDNDDMRRGKPSCHKAYGEALAILAGDAIHALAFSCLANSRTLKKAQKIKLLSLLAETTGGSGMCAGQALDVACARSSVSFENVRRIQKLKTGALFSACVHMPLACASQTSPAIVQSLENYARNVGLCFQSQDDWIDAKSNGAGCCEVTMENEPLVNLEKSGLPSLLGMQKTREEIFKLEKECLLHLSPLGQSADKLRMLTKYIAHYDPSDDH